MGEIKRTPWWTGSHDDAEAAHARGDGGHDTRKDEGRCGVTEREFWLAFAGAVAVLLAAVVWPGTTNRGQ